MRGNRKRSLKHESHDSFRDAMRIVGPLLILVGGGLFIAGIVSFFGTFDTFNQEPKFPHGLQLPGEGGGTNTPSRFWMCFVGLPLAGVGIWCVRVGFLGAAARYVAGETAPVARDAINYVVDGTKESIRDVAGAIRGDTNDDVACPKCGHSNDADAKFCDDCGTALALTCPKCGEANDADAKFCASCGSPVA